MNKIFFRSKRGMMAVLALLVVSALCMAQTETDVFNQSGNAGREMQADGLRAAHPSLPFGSKVTVTNLANNKVVEVTITGRIPPSSGKIIDLSPAAASALELDSDGKVLVRMAAASLPSPVVEPEPYVAVSEPEPEPEPAPEPEPYVAEAEPEPEPEPEPQVAEAEPEPEPEPQVAVTEPEPEPAPHEVVEQADPSGDQQAWLAIIGKEPSPLSPPVITMEHVITVIPALPNPNSPKPFNLQVGAYSNTENANWAYRVLQDGGFHPAWERNGNVYRVFLAGIPARDVYAVIQRLGVLGFREVWVRE